MHPANHSEQKLVEWMEEAKETQVLGRVDMRSRGC